MPLSSEETGTPSGLAGQDPGLGTAVAFWVIARRQRPGSGRRQRAQAGRDRARSHQTVLRARAWRASGVSIGRLPGPTGHEVEGAPGRAAHWWRLCDRQVAAPCSGASSGPRQAQCGAGLPLDRLFDSSEASGPAASRACGLGDCGGAHFLLYSQRGVGTATGARLVAQNRRSGPASAAAARARRAGSSLAIDAGQAGTLACASWCSLRA